MTEFQFDLSEFVDLFIDESRQDLSTLNQGMLTLEHPPGDAESLENVFRAAHTLKGMAATMGYEAIATTSHALEDVLQNARVRPLEVIPTALPLVFRTIDALESLVDAVAAGESAEGDVSFLLSELSAFSVDGIPGRPSGAPDEDPGFSDAPTLVEVVAGEAEGPLVAVDGETDGATEDTLATEAVPDAAASAFHARFGVSPLVRIDVQHLDRLLDIVTEMVIHRSYLSRLQTRFRSQELDEAFARLGQLLAQLQNAVVLLPEKLADFCEKYRQNTYIVVEDVLNSLMDIQDFFYSDALIITEEGISPTAKIDESAVIGSQVYIGHNVCIGKSVVIGDGTKIMHNSCLFDNVSVGSSTHIYPGVCIYKNCRIGNDCLIHSGVRIGLDGFRFEKHPECINSNSSADRNISQTQHCKDDTSNSCPVISLEQSVSDNDTGDAD